MLYENGKPTTLGVVLGVVAVGAIIYTGKRLLWDEDTEGEAREAVAKITDENSVLKATCEVTKAQADVKLAKAELLTFSNERMSLLLNEKAESLAKREQEVSHDFKALKALEKKLLASATPTP